MASYTSTWKPFIFLLSLLFRGALAASSQLPINATSVQVGFILESTPRSENHNTDEVVLDRKHLGSTLSLLCFINPRLPHGLEYETNKNEIVKWEKILNAPQKADSMRYWSKDRSKTAIHYGNVSFHVIGTYECSYGRLSATISVKVQDANIAKELYLPTNYSEVYKYVTHMKDLSSIPGWESNAVITKGVGSNFSCKHVQHTSSPKKPLSVHLVRPSDVNIVGALGDANTAGLGAKATSWNGFFTEYKSASWSIGGGDHLDRTATLPNIVMKYNPNLHGFSSRKGSWNLNIASSSASTSELERQVDELVKKMQLSPDVDFDKDWKVVTMAIGSFDLCHICKDQMKFSPSVMIKHVMHSLSTLKKKTKRVFVNLVLPMDVSILHSVFTARPHCKILGWSACPCIASGLSEERKMVSEAATKYKELLEKLINSGIYDVGDSFVVVLQPFMYNGPRTQTGDLVMDVFGPDCLHLNTKGHASAARALWNNMLEPVGSKSDVWIVDAPLKCPTKTNPYLATRTNSQVVVGMEDTTDDDAEDLTPGAAVAIAVVLAAVVVIVTIFVVRSRRSRPRNEAIRLITYPYRPPSVADMYRNNRI